MPVPSESVCWFYRVCGGGRFRVYAVHREEMARLLEFARSHSLKFDLAIPAALAETPEEILQVVLGEAPPEEFRPIRCRGLKNLSLALFACKRPASQITQESCSGIPCFLGDLRNTRDFTVSLVIEVGRSRRLSHSETHSARPRRTAGGTSRVVSEILRTFVSERLQMTNVSWRSRSNRPT